MKWWNWWCLIAEMIVFFSCHVVNGINGAWLTEQENYETYVRNYDSYPWYKQCLRLYYMPRSDRWGGWIIQKNVLACATCNCDGHQVMFRISGFETTPCNVETKQFVKLRICVGLSLVRLAEQVEVNRWNCWFETFPCSLETTWSQSGE